MSETVDRAAGWIYRGLWGVLSGWFRVPEHAPTLPAKPGEFIRSFHPSRRYLSYLRWYFWVVLALTDVAIAAGWMILYANHTELGVLLAVPALLLAVVPDIFAYIAIHLRYDTMWYVMTDRSLRCRRGIWVILEHTITFENVQNVHVRRGPLQSLFGISTIVVETAGAAEGDDQNQFAVGNKAILEGIDNPKEIRELILDRVQHSRSAGLGDERSAPTRSPGVWSQEHVGALRQILDSLRNWQRVGD